MASNIDEAVPPFGSATTAGVRANFLAAKEEITDLQLARILRLSSTDDLVEIFQQCAVNNTPQVVSFTGVTFINPASSESFEFDVLNNEIVFNETGWFNVTINCHVVRKIGGGGIADWSIHSQLKPPAGSFSNFPSSLRITSLTGDVANHKRFVDLSFVSRVLEVGTRLRWLQTCSDVTKEVGIISYPEAGVLPSAAGVVLSMHRIAEL